MGAVAAKRPEGVKKVVTGMIGRKHAGEEPKEHPDSRQRPRKSIRMRWMFNSIGVVALIVAVAVVSLTLAQQPGVGMTLFAFDAGEGVSTHAAPGDAMAHVLEGTAQITIDGASHTVSEGSAVIMPAGVPHAVKAISPFKMLLTVVKAG